VTKSSFNRVGSVYLLSIYNLEIVDRVYRTRKQTLMSIRTLMSGIRNARHLD